MTDRQSRPAEEEAATLSAEIRRLNKVVDVLMDRVEMNMSAKVSDFGLFQTTITLENEVRERTSALEAAVLENERANRALKHAKEQMQAEIEERRRIHAELEQEKNEQRILIAKLQEAQNQLLQSEKMASVGQLAAGVAHEINNPVGFIRSNLSSLKRQVEDLLSVIDAYLGADTLLEATPPVWARIEAAKNDADLEFLRQDIFALIGESLDGVDRVKKIVQDLKDFSRIDTAEWQFASLEKGLDSTLNIVTNEIKYKVEVIKEYAGVPEIECIASQLNQVLMNLMINAAHAIDDRGTMTLRTGFDDCSVWVEVADTGKGIPPENMKRVFEPFFTTKPIGKGTGLGLSLAWSIVQRHHGTLSVASEPGVGTTFRVAIPRCRTDTGDTLTEPVTPS